MNEIEFSEVTTDETGTYLAIWKNDIHHSFLIEDVLEAMTNTDTARAIEFTGGSAATLSEALDQWEAERRKLADMAEIMTGGMSNDVFEAFDMWEKERQALGELFDDNQALTISVRRYQVTLALAEKAIAAVEKDAAMFVTEKSRNAIEQFREQMQKIENLIANDKMIVADAQTRRHSTDPAISAGKE